MIILVGSPSTLYQNIRMLKSIQWKICSLYSGRYDRFNGVMAWSNRTDSITVGPFRTILASWMDTVPLISSVEFANSPFNNIKKLIPWQCWRDAYWPQACPWGRSQQGTGTPRHSSTAHQPWYLYQMVIQKCARMWGLISVIWSVYGIVLDRGHPQIWFLFF